ncbi:MAG: Gfo/Idh/MocA family oxidoreductase [Clostridia bacterium]|nr:Gfo/Idh/MocA family oxidoreductase [Clostridia bacterium]
MAIKLGIIGYGGMAHWHRESGLKNIPGFEVIGVYDVDPAKIEEARSQGMIGYDKLEDMLANPDINLCLVATPNQVHKELTIAALNAGKNVVCEKPVTLTVKDLDEMIAASEKNNKLFTVHQNRRWDADYLVAKKVFDSGILGDVFTIQSRLHGTGGIMHGWRALPECGGGMVYDWGVHFIDQICNMVPGKITDISADLHSVKNLLIDDYFMAQLKFDTGVQVMIEIGTFLLKPTPRWYMAGNAGTLQIDDFSGVKGGITKVSKLAELIPPVIVNTPAGPTRTFAPQPPETLEQIELPSFSGGWSDFYKNVDAAIEGKEELIVKPCQVRRVLGVLEKIFESAKTGHSVKYE